MNFQGLWKTGGEDWPLGAQAVLLGASPYPVAFPGSLLGWGPGLGQHRATLKGEGGRQV